MSRDGATVCRRRAPLIPGLPPWLFFAVALLVLLLSFLYLEVRGHRAQSKNRGARIDLLRIPGAQWLLQRRWSPGVVQVPVVLLFALVVAAGLLGNPAPDRNIAPVLTWTIWWTSLVLLLRDRRERRCADRDAATVHVVSLGDGRSGRGGMHVPVFRPAPPSHP